MNRIVLKAHAKVNLFLDILRKRDDGYHDIYSIMQSVSLADEVTLARTPGQGLSITCSDPLIPSDDRNIAMRIARKIESYIGQLIDVHIDITKNIPSEAGLAGGSADGAAVLAGINELIGLQLSLSDMVRIAQSVGSDIPFCLAGGTCLAEGRGELLTRLSDIETVSMIVIKPTFSISTAWAYQQYAALAMEARKRQNVAERILDPSSRPSAVYNVFERICASRYPEIETIKQNCRDLGADYVLMSGSGSALFAVSHRQEVLDAIGAYYASVGYSTYQCSTVPHGVEIVEAA